MVECTGFENRQRRKLLGSSNLPSSAHKYMLKLIKTIHTIIWAIMVLAIFYIIYAGITKTRGMILWFSIGLVIIEIITLVINRFVCPLTNIAMKYTTERSSNFDIYLPEWLAKHNKLIFGILLTIGLVLVVINLV